MKHGIKPILVTGSHRSGSTWAGKMLAAAPHTAYIHEPFNIGIDIGVTREEFSYWFQYIGEDNEAVGKLMIDEVIHFNYPLLRNIRKIKSSRNAKKLIKDQLLFWLHQINGNAPVIKDPIALFSAEWLSETFDMNVLVMIRHPAAFCSSLKIKHWQFDFSNFLNQPLLMDRYLHKYEQEIREHAAAEKDIIDQAILLWNCAHHVINMYQERHPEWLFIRHEDLSLEPVKTFRLIYKKLGLDFTDQARNNILETSGAHNPVEQQARNEFVRNSEKNISNWKNRLSDREIKLIKEKTSEISLLFYTEDEW